MISYNEAVSIIDEQFKKFTPAVERVALLQSINRILAEDIISDINLPPFNNSAMDGYAIVYSPSNKEWNVNGIISAGNYKEYSADVNSALEIMTGSKVPDGFDTIIPIEDVVVKDDKIVLREGADYRKGINIRKAGEDLTAGKIILNSNIIITSKEIAALASIGRSEINVYRKLKIGILTTGDELIDITDTPVMDKIRASNLYALLAAVQEMNMESVNLGILKDDVEKIKEKIDSALASDLHILITTGGISVGKYDLLKNIFIEAGVDIKFHKVNIKPGKPVLFGTFNNDGKLKLIFGLPGNPVSALVGFIIFIKKSILTRFDIKAYPEIAAVLGSDIRKNDSKLHFIRGNIEQHGETVTAYAGKSQSSGNIAQMASADCLIMINEDVKNPGKGEKVNCIMI